MTTADITVLPIGRAGASVSDLLVVIARHLEAQEKVRFEMHAMGTSLEGEAGEIFALAAEIHALPLQAGVPRVYTVLKVDQRTDKEQTLESKVESVRKHL
ncbi:MAG: MTH1187 family thiamine-binding protein [Solirubrobacterales bacterium]|nr:MTH1187 family thiamine-binding protein [Solirubrobacterales bacterium]HMT04907.1 MTH1187 family thiamine-binding protein [Solirubrobacterales bacterium]